MTAMQTATPAEIAEADVINSATPIEMSLLGVHPRMMTTRRPFDELRGRLDQEPWKGWFENLTKQADSFLTMELPEKLLNTSFKVMDVRGLGEQMLHLAFMVQMTGEQKYRDRLDYLMQRLTDEPSWGHSLVYGHWARGFSFALDWLWHDFDETTRARHIETLYSRTKHVFDQWASYRSGEPFGYTWNIAAVVLGGVMATAACLYGERPDIAPIANMAWEKMRLQSAALGPDGVSPEGSMYGGYYAGYLTVSFLLAEDMFGFDLYGTTPWLKRHPSSLLAQTISRESWKASDMFFLQGDAHGYIFGIEGIVRLIASCLQDNEAQWFADEILCRGAMGPNLFSFIMYDPDLKPVMPSGQKPMVHLEDYDIAVMRGDWSGTESVSVMKCGPNVGHHAVQRFTHPLGGGHMHPNNGELQIFSHGEWILPHPGYVWKDTSYHNTLLIDGKGQYGEDSEWLEDLPYRQRRKYPFMERVGHHGTWDYCVANMTEAYPEELGVTSMRRHVVYVRPDAWIVVDALEANREVMPTALFHTKFPLADAGEKSYTGEGEHAGARLRFVTPADISVTAEEQPRINTFRVQEGVMPLLRVSPVSPTKRYLGVTEVQSYEKGASAAMDVRVEVGSDENSVRIIVPCVSLDVTLHPFGNEDATVV